MCPGEKYRDLLLSPSDYLLTKAEEITVTMYPRRHMPLEPLQSLAMQWQTLIRLELTLLDGIINLGSAKLRPHDAPGGDRHGVEAIIEEIVARQKRRATARDGGKGKRRL